MKQFNANKAKIITSISNRIQDEARKKIPKNEVKRAISDIKEAAHNGRSHILFLCLYIQDGDYVKEELNALGFQASDYRPDSGLHYIKIDWGSSNSNEEVTK